MIDFNTLMQSGLDERCHKLDSDKIIELDKSWKMPDLKNVIVGLEKHCFGIVLLDTTKTDYLLFYVNGENELSGYVFDNSIDNKYRDNLTFLFSNFLAKKFKSLDVINVFNTFQQKIRSLLENMGIMTISTSELDKYKDQSPEIIGAVIITTINKINFYKEFFGFTTIQSQTDKINHVYLMLNDRNDFIKIGRSINPTIREKTLQSEEPNISVVACWEAPISVEKELHLIFSKKRIRGEWFNLTFTDLKEIKEKMSIYTVNS